MFSFFIYRMETDLEKGSRVRCCTVGVQDHRV